MVNIELYLRTSLLDSNGDQRLINYYPALLLALSWLIIHKRGLNIDIRFWTKQC